MSYTIMGIEKVDYKSKKTGQQVRGTNLHCAADVDNPRIDGCGVDRFYVPERINLYGLAVGDHVDVFFNRYGSVDDVRVVNK